MTTRSNRRLVALFLATVLLPCAVLLSIALHTMQREREFEVMRASEYRARRLVEVRQLLFSRLETVRDRAAAGSIAHDTSAIVSSLRDSTVRLVAEVRAGSLLLDWEMNRRAQPPGGAFEGARHSGEIAEFSRRDHVSAAKSYAAAIAAAKTVEQGADARLSLARVLGAGGRQSDSEAEYNRLLALPFAVTDEHGVPYAAYAASRLLGSPAIQEGIRRLESGARAACCVSSEGWFMVREIADSILRRKQMPGGIDLKSVSQLRVLAERRAADEEQGAKLRSDFGDLGIASASARSESGLWFQYGAHPWFVSIARNGSKGRTILVAIDAPATIATLNQVVARTFPPVVRLSLASRSTSGVPAPQLTPEFPTVRASFGGLSGAAPLLATPFYLGMLLLVVCVSLFGAYMVWYDVRRELRLSELRSHFVASVSHELKTPLTSIRMFAETLLLRSPGPKVESEYLSNIVSETERLTRLLNNVLDVSKIDRGEKIYRFAETSLPDVIARCARTMEYPLSQHGLRLNVEADHSLPPISADEDAVQQAVLNLLANALKYSNGFNEVDLVLRRGAADAVIEVRDRGVGIPKEFVPRLVEKFFRVPSPENARIPGTGLGLTLVDHIARAHGGSLEIESEPGEGTTVAIHLPLERAV